MGVAVEPVCWNFEELPPADFDYFPCFTQAELGRMGSKLRDYLKGGRTRSEAGAVGYMPPVMVWGQNNTMIPWIGRGFGPYQSRWGGVTAAKIADFAYSVKLIAQTGKVKLMEIGPPGLARGVLGQETFQTVQMPVPCLPPGIQFGAEIPMVSNPGDVVRILNAEIPLSRARLVTAIDTNVIEGIASIIATLGYAASVRDKVEDCKKTMEQIYQELKAGNVKDAAGKIPDLAEKDTEIDQGVSDFLRDFFSDLPDVLPEVCAAVGLDCGAISEARQELCELLRSDDPQALATLAGQAAQLFGVTGEIRIGDSTMTLAELLDEIGRGRVALRCAQDPCPFEWRASPTFEVAGQSLKLCMSPEFLADRGLMPTIPGTDIPITPERAGAIVALLLLLGIGLLIASR